MPKAKICGECGSLTEIQAHHEDYGDEGRFNVLWLCRCCHIALHKKENRGEPEIA